MPGFANVTVVRTDERASIDRSVARSPWCGSVPVRCRRWVRSSPTILPAASDGSGLDLRHTAPASASLLDDLRSDRGMEWVPERAWLMKLSVGGPAGDLRYDLAVDTTGVGRPSRVAAGLERPSTSAADEAVVATAGPSGEAAMWLAGALLVVTVVGGAGAWVRRGRGVPQERGHDAMAPH